MSSSLSRVEHGPPQRAQAPAQLLGPPDLGQVGSLALDRVIVEKGQPGRDLVELALLAATPRPTVAPGRSYRYFVRAENGAGISGFSIAALGYGVQSDPGDDGLENNDAPEEATPLPGSRPGPQREIRAVAVDGDPDWYAVTLPGGMSRLDVVVPYTAGSGSILLALYDAGGNPVASATAVPVSLDEKSKRTAAQPAAPAARHTASTTGLSRSPPMSGWGWSTSTPAGAPGGARTSTAPSGSTEADGTLDPWPTPGPRSSRSRCSTTGSS